MVKDVLNRLWHPATSEESLASSHRVEDEVDIFGRCYTHLEERTATAGANKQRHVIVLEHSDWIPVGVLHVLVSDPVRRALQRLPGSSRSIQLDPPRLAQLDRGGGSARGEELL